MSDDITGDQALKVLEIEYMRAKIDNRSQREQDDIREAICLVRGWRFDP